ncbi:unnamed protein product [Durusdinium trenchii]|uniref:UBC core domain-containing protein n=2 Tax=Durusdinium trenchii TaxID=1381693 RepID=A0ABP0SDL0_9DINO
MELPPQCHIDFPDKNNLMHFNITISPDEGFWKGASYTFVFNVAALYPHEAPKVKCETKIYHPNIDMQGNVCLNILREDWKPVLSISLVVYGLLYLFLEPNPGDPLNHEAAEVLRNNRGEFGRIVARTLRGGAVAGHAFPKHLASMRKQLVANLQCVIRCLANATLAWCQSLLSPAGLAHCLSLACFLVQVILINVFLVQYLSPTVLLTLTVDVPLLLHLAWFWRVECAYRAAPTQWFCYSWVHAAKVVVLFCRVMPRLASATPSVSEEFLRGSDFSINASYFQDLFSPTMLANLLLITPVFYALLMFRASKAIFGSLSKRVTVDLIMQYDMLWHVVIDMVDQVDMFYYARLAEWVGG